MRESENIQNLEKVSQGLGEMPEDMIFVGGAVVELYATDPGPLLTWIAWYRLSPGPVFGG